MSDRAWLMAICLSELGAMLVFFSAGFAAAALGPAVFGVMLDWAPALGASPDSRRLWAFGVLGVVARAGPLAVEFKEFSPRKSGV